MNYLGIDEFNYRENSFNRDGKKYLVTDLIEASKKYEPFEIPIAGIDIGINPWGDQTIKSFCYHVQRLKKCDLNYPVILDNTGYICDGWHRLAKAIIEGKETIMAVRLTVMPEPISYTE